MGGNGTYLLLIAGLFLLGVGMGMFTPPNNSSVMGSAPSNRLGVAGGVLNMARTFGMGFGVTFGGLLFQLFVSLNAHFHKAGTQSMISSFRYAYAVIFLLGIAAVLISATRKQPSRPHPDYFIGDGI
jgi:MFS family permease